MSVDYTGLAWILAAGATNTSGTGNELRMSRGVIPSDQANTRAVGMELMNGGTGQGYTQAQLDTAFKLSNGINAWCGNQPSDVFSHNGYTLSDPGNPNGSARKIDPATAAAAGAGGWVLGSVNSSGTWSNDDLIAECLRRAGTLPPIDDEDEMKYVARDSNRTIWIGDTIHRRAPTWDEYITAVAHSASGSGQRLINVSTGQLITDPNSGLAQFPDDQIGFLGSIVQDD